MTRTNLVVLIALVCVPQLASGAPKKGAVTAKVAVNGAVELRLTTIDADIDLSPGPGKSVTVTVDGSDVKSIGLVKRGKNGIEVTFDGDDQLRQGAVHVSVPAGSDANLTSVSGDVRVSGVGGNLRVKAVSGDVVVDKAKGLDITSVSGDLDLRAVGGAVNARTVSGDAVVNTTGRADAKLEFETTSGELKWRGTCGKGCALEAKTLSGEVQLELDQASSFNLEFTSFSGELDDKLGVEVKRSKTNRHGGGTVNARYRDGAGSIEIESFSAELELKKK